MVESARRWPAVHPAGLTVGEGYVESFNGKLRDKLLDRKIFYTPKEAHVLIEHWRQNYNRMRPHSS